MKTLKDFRKIIEDSDGKLKIGELVFSYKDDSDIDIHIGGDFAGWISYSIGDDELLSETGIFTSSDSVLNTDFVSRLREENKSLKSKIASLTEENNKLKQQLESANYEANAMQESTISDKVKLGVYEKLFERDITLKSSDQSN